MSSSQQLSPHDRPNLAVDDRERSRWNRDESQTKLPRISISTAPRQRRRRPTEHHDDRHSLRSLSPDSQSPENMMSRDETSPPGTATKGMHSLRPLIYDKSYLQKFMRQVPEWRWSVTGASNWCYDKELNEMSLVPGSEYPDKIQDGSRLIITDLDQLGSIVHTRPKPASPVILQTQDQYNEYLCRQISSHLSEQPDAEGGGKFWRLLMHYDALAPYSSRTDSAGRTSGLTRPRPFGRYLQAVPTSLLCRALLDMRSKLDKDEGIGHIPAKTGYETRSELLRDRALCDRFNNGSSLFGTNGITQVLDLSTLTCLTPAEERLPIGSERLAPRSDSVLFGRYRIRLTLNLYAMPMRKSYEDPFRPWQVTRVVYTKKPDIRMSSSNVRVSQHGHMTQERKAFRSGVHAFLEELLDVLKQLRGEMRTVVDRLRQRFTSSHGPLFTFDFDEKAASHADKDQAQRSKSYLAAIHTLSVIMHDIVNITTIAKERAGPTSDFEKQLYGWRWHSVTRNGRSPWQNEWTDFLAKFDSDLKKILDSLHEVSVSASKVQKEISNRFDYLCKLTSINESRQSNDVAQASMELARISTAQNRNIKLFTIITVFFLPLSYVTSVFGMQAMPNDKGFANFAYATVAVCLPTYLIIIAIWPLDPLAHWLRLWERHAPDRLLRMTYRSAFQNRVREREHNDMVHSVPAGIVLGVTPIFRPLDHRVGTEGDIKV